MRKQSIETQLRTLKRDYNALIKIRDQQEAMISMLRKDLKTSNEWDERIRQLEASMHCCEASCDACRTSKMPEVKRAL